MLPDKAALLEPYLKIMSGTFHRNSVISARYLATLDRESDRLVRPSSRLIEEIVKLGLNRKIWSRSNWKIFVGVERTGVALADVEDSCCDSHCLGQLVWCDSLHRLLE